jgi:hypothetical protein
MTLLEDLEAAADVIALREANDIQPLLDSTLGARLRAAATRLREEMGKHWFAGPCECFACQALTRINNGPVTAGGGERLLK